MTNEELSNALAALRDSLFWYEDAAGITEDTPEKKILDRALDELAELRESRKTNASR